MLAEIETKNDVSMPKLSAWNIVQPNKVETHVMVKAVTVITIDEIMEVNNPIMVITEVNSPIMEIMVLVINVAAVVEEEEIMVVINNVVEVPPITEIPTDECKPIRNRSIFKSRSYLCVFVWEGIEHIRLVKLSFSFCLSFVRINRHFLYLPSEHLLVFFFLPYFTDFDCCSRAAAAAVLLSFFLFRTLTF